MSLANKLEYLRKQRGLTRAELARKLGLKYTTYVGYENGEREPGHGFLIDVARFYNVSVDFLLDMDSGSLHVHEQAPKYGQPIDDTDEILEMLKNDPDTRMVAKISGDLTEEGKKELLKHAKLLRNQRDRGWDD